MNRHVYLLGSMDTYSFTAADNADEKMGWNNMVGAISWHVDGRKAFSDIRASVPLMSRRVLT